MTAPINVIVQLKSPIGTTTNLGIPAIAAVLSAEAIAAWGPDRVKRFAADSWQEQAEALEIVSTDEIYVTLQAMFADHPRQLFKPAYAVVIRRLAPVAQVITVTVGGNGDGDYTNTINGTAFTHGAVGQTATQIRDALVVLIEAGSQPVTAAPHADPDKYTLTSDTPGLSFTSLLASPSDVLTQTTTTPNVGIAEDLAAAELEDRTWYCLTETSGAYAAIKEAGKFVQSMSRPAIFGDFSVSTDVSQNVDTDVASEMKALSYWRTFLTWHDNAAEKVVAGWIGRCVAYPVGQVNWAHKQIAGSTAIDFTDPGLAGVTANLEAKNVNRYDAIGLSSTLYGTMIDGRFIDQVMLKDLLTLRITEYLLLTLQTTDIVTFDDEGVAILKDALKAVLKEVADQGALRPTSIVITPIPADDIGPSDKAARNYSGLKWSVKARGAVNRLINITGIVEL